MAAQNDTLTAVAGLQVGHWTDLEAATGCTVILCGDGATAGFVLRGGGPGTRETDLLRPETAVQQVHGIMLSGGSAFGLAAADGVVRWLEERGVGFDVMVTKVPIVPAAVLLDLLIGRYDIRPDADAGYAACEAATTDAVAQGNVGAGTGATVGGILGGASAMKGGLGSAALQLGNGVTVGALAAVNCFGDVADPDTGAIVAGARAPGGGWLNTATQLVGMGALPQFGNTTLVVVATDAAFTQAQCTAIANMAHFGLARAIRGQHLVEGDIVFALATGDKAGDVSAVGTAAAEAVSRSIVRAVRAAETLHGVPAHCDL
jgi:L-aminopeptidase/D-esterase-like protein